MMYAHSGLKQIFFLLFLGTIVGLVYVDLFHIRVINSLMCLVKILKPFGILFLKYALHAFILVWVLLLICRSYIKTNVLSELFMMAVWIGWLGLHWIKYLWYVSQRTFHGFLLWRERGLHVVIFCNTASFGGDLYIWLTLSELHTRFVWYSAFSTLHVFQWTHFFHVQYIEYSTSFVYIYH